LKPASVAAWAVERCGHCGEAMARANSIAYVQVHMALTKKTIVLFPPELHRHLARVAAERHTSLAELVRRACEREYGVPSREEKLAAVERLAILRLPVSSPAQMKRELVPDARKLAP
jgi:hypothetical protein